SVDSESARSRTAGDATHGERNLDPAEGAAVTDDGHSASEQWELEFLDASAVSVDPRALSLLTGEDCRRLRAVPLSAFAGGAVVAVASPSEERFAGVRELTGQNTRFVLIAESTLDGLLASRMF